MNILWFGPTTYALPIEDHTILNKIRYISQHFSLHIVALHPLFWPKIVTYQKTQFYLLPKIPQITNILQIIFSPVLILLIIKHRISLLVSQGIIFHGIISIIVKKILSILGIKLKVLIDVHGEWEKTPFLYRGKKPSHFVLNCIRRIGSYVLNNGDAIRVVNKALYKKIASVTSKPIHILPMYTNLEFFLKEPTTQKLGFGQNKQVLFAGGLYYIKGVQYLIQAMSEIIKQIDNLSLIIAGEGPLKNELQLLTKKFEIQDSVHFIGHVSKKILKDLYYSSSVVVLPSLSEGLPRVILEAMACARPVIATDVGGISELIKDGENGFLVPPADYMALKQKIDSLFTDMRLSKELGENGRNFILENFRGKKLLEGYVELYKKILRD